MDALITCLPAILRSAGNSPEVVEAAAGAAWRHSVGAGLRQHAVPVRLEEGTLIVAVPDAVWQRQLRLMLGELLFRVNKLLGQPLVNYIDLRIDAALVNKHSGSSSATLTDEVRDVPLELYSAANAIADKELRQSFLKAAIKQTRRLEEGDK